MAVIIGGVFGARAKSGQAVEPEWGKWSNWSTCSSTCGEGQRQRKSKCQKNKNQSVGCKLSESSDLYQVGIVQEALI